MKKQFNKLFAVILACIMLFAPASTGAFAGDTQELPDSITDDSLIMGPAANAILPRSSARLTLQQLQAKFPHGKYWNHVGGSNNPDGWTSVPCTHHDNCGYYPNNCACNSFDNAIQCMGFTMKLAYDAYGTSARSWNEVTNLNGLKAGDIVRYATHSIFVTAVNGDTITYGDANAINRTCNIRWNQTTTKAAIRSKGLKYVKVAPWELSRSAIPDNMVRGSLVSGDFNGDHKMEMAAFFGTGHQMQLIMWDADQNNFDMSKGRVVCSSNDFAPHAVAGRVVSGDFNGDGYCDIGAIYDYGNGSMAVWVFKGSVSGDMNTAYQAVSASEFSALNITDRVVAGDFNGDGYCDVATFFDYGGGSMSLWIFEGSSSGNMNRCYKACSFSEFSAPNITNRVVAGDFNGDGYCDVGAFFDYGEGNMSLWVFEGNSTGIIQKVYKACSSSDFQVHYINGRVVAGDFNGDGYCDVGAFFDYGNHNMGLWIFPGAANGDMNASYKACSSNDYDVNCITDKIVSGDFDRDGKDEINALYDYGGFNWGLWRFDQFDGHDFTAFKAWGTF